MTIKMSVQLMITAALLFTIGLPAYAEIYQCFKGSQISYQDHSCGTGTDSWQMIDRSGDPTG